MNVCAILMLSMASIMCSVIGSVKTFFRPLSLSPPSEFIEEEEEKRAKNAKFFRFPADVFHMTLIRIIWLFFLWYISNVKCFLFSNYFVPID